MSRNLIAVCLALSLSACASPKARSDAPAESDEFVVLPMQFASANEVAGQLTSLLRDRPTLRVIPDSRTNSVLLTGSTDEIAAAREIVAALDRRAPGS